ncbi:PREDICTED: uncharacterized protein LOC109584611 [Amphimedon queenslandica]|uniref:Death domain-containing protein n=2 Tax=Amphimedon queenslandica TaxID=400682 RepID=A0AAN0JH43_AMPQE|nr:PREDICTED: uncharacterized protein LOC109584611 [Amphimedon queenslandica]|eukprot:XP_019855983.1 PREDICTED: uncharacterized protein LOC109584611 [Amphimedon queenslandica]
MASCEGSFLLSLDISHLQLVRDALKSGKFSDADWLNLGLKLGLQYPDLKSIKKDNDSNSERLMECLSLWLNSSSVRTWEMLASALEELDRAAAEHIRKKYCDPASQILQHYSSRISSIVFSISSIQLLYTEGLIMEESQKRIEGCGSRLTRDILLNEILINVVEDNRKLIKLGHIIMKSKEGVSIANDMIKDCKQTFAPELNSPEPSPSASSASATKEVEKVTNPLGTVISVELLQAEHQYSFDKMRGNFGIFRFKVLELVDEKISSLNTFKTFLQQCYPELESQLSVADSVQSAMNVALTKCNIINIAAVEDITEFYKIDGAEELITEYKKVVKQFCSKIPLDSLLNKRLSTNSTLTCETIRFVLDWKPDEHSLNDIRLLLQKAFADLGKRVIVQVICPDNSIIIICYAPQHLMSVLILRVQENLPILIKQFSLMELTIGHCICYNSKNHESLKLCFEGDNEMFDTEIQELIVFYKDRKESIADQEKRLKYLRNRQNSEMRFKLLDIGKVFKSKLHDLEQLILRHRSGQKELLLRNRDEITLLEKINHKLMSQIKKADSSSVPSKKDQSTSPLSKVLPMAKDILIVRFDYHRIDETSGGNLTIKEGEKLETHYHYLLTGASTFNIKILQSGLEVGFFFPHSHLQSMLETLQLYQFIMVEQEVSLPILQKIKNGAHTDDEKIFLFLECLDNDPILLNALRYDKHHYEKGFKNNTAEYKDYYAFFHHPSPDQCRNFIKKFNKTILSIHWLCPISALILLPSLIHHKSTLINLAISYSPLPIDCIKYLCELLTDNEALEHLAIANHSISDKGVISICQALQHNTTLNSLDLHGNPLITSASAPALVHLICTTSTLSVMYLDGTQLSLESLELIFQSLQVNKSMRTLEIDKKHKGYCTKNYNYLLPVLKFY